MYHSENNRRISDVSRLKTVALLGREITSLVSRCVGGSLGRVNWIGHFFDLVAGPCSKKDLCLVDGQSLSA